MFILDGIGLGAQRRLARIQREFAKIRRTLVTVSNAKVVLAAPPATNGHAKNGRSNGAHKAPAARPAAPTPKPLVAPEPAPIPDVAPEPVPAPVAAVASVAAAPVAPVAPPAPVPAAPPAPLPAPAPAGSVMRRPQPIFSPPKPPEATSNFSLRTDPRSGEIYLGEQATGEAGGARLREARRLNWIAICGVAIALVNLVGLFVAIYMAGTMIKSATAATKDSLSATKVDQRAWVGLGETTLLMRYSKTKIGMTMNLDNTGKTPASIDAIDVKVTAVDTASNRRTVLTTRHIGSRSLSPSGHETLTVLEAKPLSDGDFASLVNSRTRHEFAVVVRYRDVFGDGHHTNICKAIGGSAVDMSFGSTFASCDPNDMD
jgi:hypothetical protein